MTADQRQRDAIHLVFGKFRELGSIRQAYSWFHRNAVELPVRTPGQGLVWRVPTSSRRVTQILTNPIYAGAYAYGRRRQETVLDNGRKRVRRGTAKHDPQARWPMTALRCNHLSNQLIACMLSSLISMTVSQPPSDQMTACTSIP